jgi:hypothetical protein
MNTKNPSLFRTLAAGAFVGAFAMLLAACEPVVGTANASPADTPAVSTAAVYFGTEYADVQAKLPADTKPAAPSF